MFYSVLLYMLPRFMPYCVSTFSHWYLYIYRSGYLVAICPDQWIQNGLYCYYFSNYSAPQVEAQATCVVDYANLADIADDPENLFLAAKGSVYRSFQFSMPPTLH